MFGCMVVIGETENDMSICGAFVVSGHDHMKYFRVAEDSASFHFKRLDLKVVIDRHFVRDVWIWDKPVDGRSVIDGKIFK